MEFIEPKFEALINGKWRKVLQINYQTYEPTISFRGENGTFWSKWGGSGIITTEISGWKLKGTKLRVTAVGTKPKRLTKLGNNAQKDV
jgi:hypothetical protein